ncbi:DNA-binding response regulator [Lentzea sp. NBRC 105346]|uniref:response regulator transcription factor n=1 Tax=Lentzea sp. NBRC 105346 TaxID=3032205 RepID=UPI00249FB9C7|nr:response regulator transcription factor [Lentzea sp. NBRC 105346]GLZ30127.1 DNA-binding response regulator [Lentzea sp. NBRC 105346]
MPRVLVVEDDPDIARIVALLLARSNYQVERAGDGRSGLRAVFESKPDLVVLDIGLPGMDGLDALERIRDLSDVPVLLLSARDQESDKIRGLRAGADDYLTKPFTNGELVARVEALLRRARPAQWAERVYDDGTLRIDPMARLVHVDEREVSLTPIEFRLLNTLTRNAGVTLSSRKLLAEAWEDPTGIGADRVKFTVLRLRRKLGWDDSASSPIESVRGVGYRYRPPAQSRHRVQSGTTGHAER